MYILAAISFSFNFGLTLMLIFFFFFFLLLCDLFAVYIKSFFVCYVIFYRIIFLCSYSCQPCFFLFVYADFLINLPKYIYTSEPGTGAALHPGKQEVERLLQSLHHRYTTVTVCRYVSIK